MQMYIFFGTGSNGTVEYFDGPSRTVKYLRDVNGDPVIHWDGIASNDITAPCAASARSFVKKTFFVSFVI